METQAKDIGHNLIHSILKERKPDAHKGTYGHLLLTVGSDRYRGAAVLSALGAYYIGVGLATVASTEKVISSVASRVPEAIFLDISENEKEYLDTLTKANACLIGCGLTTSNQALKLLEMTLFRAHCPLIMDADALNLLAQNMKLLDNTNRFTVLMPHLKEFSRLISTPVEMIAENKETYAKEFASKHSVYLILKSDKTIVVTPKGKVYRNTLGNSGLAKAGSGDLLAGMVAGLIAMGYSIEDSTVTGVYLHSLAADVAAGKRNLHSLTASYIAEYISKAYDMTLV